MKTKSFIDLVSTKTFNVHDRVAFLKANRTWIKKSMRIAYLISKVLKSQNKSQVELAEGLLVTPQYVSKILKGNENLTLETISKIEEFLNVELISVQIHSTKWVSKPNNSVLINSNLSIHRIEGKIKAFSYSNPTMNVDFEKFTIHKELVA